MIDPGDCVTRGEGVNVLSDEKMKPEVISFDVDGTIVKQHFADKFWWEEMPKIYARRHDMDFEEARKFLKTRYDEIGNEDRRWYLPDYWFDRFNLGKEPKTVLAGMKHELEVYPDAIEVIQTLHDQEWTMIVISNASEIFLEVELEGLKEYFARIFSCVSDFNEVKKHPRVYERAFKEFGVDPRQVLHVGNDPKFDYRVPREVGATAYLIDRDRTHNHENALRDLRALLDRIFTSPSKVVRKKRKSESS